MNPIPEENTSPEVPEPDSGKDTSPEVPEPKPVPEPADAPAEAPPVEPEPPEGPELGEIIKRFIPEVPALVIPATLLLIVLFDYFIYQSPGKIGGVGWGMLILLVGLVIWLVERPSFSRTSRTTLLCTALIIVFAARIMWQAVLTTEVIGFLLLFIFASSLKRFSPHIAELGHSLWWTVAKIPVILAGFINTLTPLGKYLPGWSLKGLRIGLAWLVPAMIVLVFLFIFSMANIVVESWMNEAWSWGWKQLAHIFDYLSVGRILFWICSFFFAVVLLLPQSVKYTILTPFLGEKETMQPSAPSSLIDMKATMAINTFIAVNIVFLLYNAVDISFLWLKRALPEGLSYSGYAHRGVLWLTMALALTSLILGIVFLRGLNFHRRTRLLKILAWVWVGQNLILALDTFRRLQVYINYNGLTRLRIVGAYGIAVVVAGLLITALKMQKVRDFLWMVRWHLIAFVLTLFALAITPMDWLVFKYNTHIILYDNPRSAIQLIVQPITAEGIPALIPLLDCEDQIISQGVAGILIREKERLQKLRDEEERLVDRELSRSYALKAIESVQPKLDKIIPDGNWQEGIDNLHKHTKKWY